MSTTINTRVAPTRTGRGKIRFALLLCVFLSNCGDGDGFNDSLNDMTDLMDAATDVLTAFSGIAADGGGYRTPSFRQSAPSYRTGGYSQKGAFDECATLFAANGDEDGARKCRTRAANMSTAH